MEGIKSKKEIDESFRLGKKFRISNGGLIVYTTDHLENKKDIRILVVIKKKTANSVRRNRIKRVIREVVRSLTGIIPEDKKVRLIFMINQPEVDFHKLKKEIENKLKFMFDVNGNKKLLNGCEEC